MRNFNFRLSLISRWKCLRSKKWNQIKGKCRRANPSNSPRIYYTIHYTLRIYMHLYMCVLLLLFALVVNSLVSILPPSVNNGTFIFFLPSLNIGDSWWKGSRSFVTQRRWHSLPPHPLARRFSPFLLYVHTQGKGKPLADWLWLPRPNYNLLLSYPLSKVIRRSPNVWDEVDVYESYIYPPSICTYS